MLTLVFLTFQKTTKVAPGKLSFCSEMHLKTEATGEASQENTFDLYHKHDWMKKACTLYIVERGLPVVYSIGWHAHQIELAHRDLVKNVAWINHLGAVIGKLLCLLSSHQIKIDQDLTGFLRVISSEQFRFWPTFSCSENWDLQDNDSYF